MRLRHCVTLAKSCKFLASLAVEGRIFVIRFPNLRKFRNDSTDEPHPLDLLKIKPDGMTRCLHCGWHGAPETDFFFRHHELEMLRLGLAPTKGALWTDAFCCVLGNLDTPRDAKSYDGRMVEVLRDRVQRFDELKRRFKEKFS